MTLGLMLRRRAVMVWLAIMALVWATMALAMYAASSLELRHSGVHPS